MGYTFHNGSGRPVWVLDDMVALASDGIVRAPSQLVVQDAPGGSVALVRGFVPATGKVQLQLVPGARRVEAGASIRGAGEVPLPLTAHHPIGFPAPLTASGDSVVLRIGYVAGDVTWDRLQLADGTRIDSPDQVFLNEHQQFAEGARLPVP